jgi:hypothetical protein
MVEVVTGAVTGVVTGGLTGVVTGTGAGVVTGGLTGVVTGAGAGVVTGAGAGVVTGGLTGVVTGGLTGVVTGGLTGVVVALTALIRFSTSAIGIIATCDISALLSPSRVASATICASVNLGVIRKRRKSVNLPAAVGMVEVVTGAGAGVVTGALTGVVTGVVTGALTGVVTGVVTGALTGVVTGAGAGVVTAAIRLCTSATGILVMFDNCCAVTPSLFACATTSASVTLGFIMTAAI